jgi:hypothetical protein
MAVIPEPHRIQVPDSEPEVPRDPKTGRFLPGHSGNPKGRKPGRWSDKLHALVPKALAAIEAALDDGDMSAVGHLLSRTVPALKAESPEVEFEFDPSGSPAEMSAQILLAVSKGQLNPDIARTLQEMIVSHTNLRDVEAFIAEFRKLKEQRGDQQIPGGVITT